MAPSFAVQSARPDELASALRLIFRHVTGDEHDNRVRNALHLIQQGELDPAGVLVIREHGRVAAAMVCMLVPGASGLVWPPQAVAGPAQAEREDRLARHAIAWLRQRGAKLGQALLPSHETQLAAPLERCGFLHITGLWYLRHYLDLPAELLGKSERLVYLTYEEADRALFRHTLELSYEGTRDCPEVTGVRTMDEVLEGHAAQGPHDPAHWWLALAGTRPVGVLLMTEMPECSAWDVSYVGVVPEARRRGVGRELMRRALFEAKAVGASQLTLSVDTRNEPAWNLYRGLGFEPFDQREVYLAVWR